MKNKNKREETIKKMEDSIIVAMKNLDFNKAVDIDKKVKFFKNIKSK